MKRIGVYAGSFDPITKGHLDILNKAGLLFDKVIVAVGTNPKKAPWMSRERRIQFIKDAIFDEDIDGNLEVVGFDGLTTNLATQEGASYLVRGLRPLGDWDNECQLAAANKLINPFLETIFIPSSPEFVSISSSLVREIYTNGSVNDIIKFVPDCVIKGLEGLL